MASIKYFNGGIISFKKNKSTANAKPPSLRFFCRRHKCRPIIMSMNGCGSDHHHHAPLGTIETRSLPIATTARAAADRLNSAIHHLKSNVPPFDSGIIRVEAPTQQQIEALDWLCSQSHGHHPRCFFSGRDNGKDVNALFEPQQQRKLVSVAGLGSAVSFRRLHPFSINDWHSIKRFLSKECPLIRAYGTIRFDGSSNISPEWEGFGSFYFTIPQVEFDEFEGSSMIAATIAWDSRLSCSYSQSIAELESTMSEVSSPVRRSNSRLAVVLRRTTHLPDKASWGSAVNRALDLICKKSSPLVKVVLARSSRVLTAGEIDPLDWLSRLQVEGVDSYQFCLQPPDSPAFIGNTPERLFYRNGLSVCSEALAGTRGRGGTESMDLQIGNDLLCSAKDHHEFAVVRESIRSRLEKVCSRTVVEPSKTLRKLPRIQHLYAELRGELRKEDDEFRILSSLHPTPAVCGRPTEDARILISETEMFDRGMYAGPVGWFGGAESEFAVGIRSALVGKGVGAILYAGTGIVEGSDAALEWQELELKTSQFTRLMKLEAPRPVMR